MGTRFDNVSQRVRAQQIAELAAEFDGVLLCSSCHGAARTIVTGELDVGFQSEVAAAAAMTKIGSQTFNVGRVTESDQQTCAFPPGSTKGTLIDQNVFNARVTQKSDELWSVPHSRRRWVFENKRNSVLDTVS